MSRKAAIVEEFDDDTDLPLPSAPLPNTGSRGPLLQEMHISDDEFEPPTRAGPASASRPQQPFANMQQQQGSRSTQGENHRVTDITPYKSWTCIYPIYLDAKRPYGTGQRRVERAKGLWWPLSKDIADAANRLGLGTLHEVNKSHPRDWENPGRVRVQWKKDGRLLNPVIKTKKQLLEMISFQLQHLKPENIPKPPYNTGTQPTSAPLPLNPPTADDGAVRPTTPNPPQPTQNKGKTPLSKSKSTSAPHHPAQTQTGTGKAKPARRRLPLPPTPHPPLSDRVSAYSPAIATGVLVETVKAGMNATAGADAANAPGTGGAPGQGQGAPGAGAKGKRKVVRVRG